MQEDIAHKKVYINLMAFVIQGITAFRVLSLQHLQMELQVKYAQLADIVALDLNSLKYVHLEHTIPIHKNLLKLIALTALQGNIVQE